MRLLKMGLLLSFFLVTLSPEFVPLWAIHSRIYAGCREHPAPLSRGELNLSIKIMSLVWDNAPYSDNTLLTFLALADHCDEQGRCWPKIENLSHKSRQSKRNVIRCLQRMKLDGYISWDKEGRENRYMVNVQKLKLGDKLSYFKGDNLSVNDLVIGDNGDIEKVTLATQIGDNGDIAIRKNRQEPSIESSVGKSPNDQVSLSLDVARAVMDHLKVSDAKGDTIRVIAEQAKIEIDSGHSPESVIESMVQSRKTHEEQTKDNPKFLIGIGKFFGEKWRAHIVKKPPKQKTLSEQYEEMAKR